MNDRQTKAAAKRARVNERRLFEKAMGGWQPFDRDRRLEGIVSPARDGRTFNSGASTLVERMAWEPAR